MSKITTIEMTEEEIKMKNNIDHAMNLFVLYANENGMPINSKEFHDFLSISPILLNQ